ncbi:MAG: hypothetical protein R3A45_12355 [Bdellovibrionota bacterium]
MLKSTMPKKIQTLFVQLLWTSGLFFFGVGLMHTAASATTETSRSQSPTQSYGNTKIQVEDAQPSEIKKALAMGTTMHINVSEIGLKAKLISYPVQGDCVAETHVVCGHQYLLTTMTLDEDPDVYVYDLGEVGEITTLRRIHADIKLIELELNAQNFPSTTLQQNSNLKIKQDRFGITFFPTGKINVFKK